jgi:hypothetical protein
MTGGEAAGAQNGAGVEGHGHEAERVHGGIVAWRQGSGGEDQRVLLVEVPCAGYDCAAPFRLRITRFSSRIGNLGRITVKTVLMLTTGILACAWVVPKWKAAAADPPSEFLAKLPGFRFGGRDYKVDAYIDAAIELQKLGEDKAIKALYENGANERGFDSTIVLARMLFVAKAKQEFRRPRIGGAQFLGDTSYKDWPLEPIEIIDGIPFLIVTGYRGSGVAEQNYLGYCVDKCDWNPTKFKRKSAREKKKALEKLLASLKWEEPLEEREKAYLAAQIK